MPVHEAEYKGVCHVHTTYSDGTGSVGEIVSLAGEMGLDFVVIADHDTLAARRDGWEGTHDGVTVIAAVEISPADGAHCMAWGVSRCAGYRDHPPEVYVGRIAREGGAAFVCHCMGRYRLWPFTRGLPAWRAWDLPGLTGMEIWSYGHDWLFNFRPWQLKKLAGIFGRTAGGLGGPHRPTLARWDAIGRSRPFVGIAGLDAHSPRVPLLGWNAFPYEELFRTLRVHVLVEDGCAPSVDSIRRAMEKGRCHVANDAVAPSDGFRFYGMSADGRRHAMGSEAGVAAKLSLHVEAPGGEAVLLKDGRPWATSSSLSFSRDVREPGVYRIKVTQNGEAWIFSNPIYVRDIE